MPKIHQFSVHPEIPPRLGGLEELALNLRWAWDTRAYAVFPDLDSEMLEKCDGNPVMLLRRTSRERLERAAADHGFVARLDEALADLRGYLAEPGWFRLRYPGHGDVSVAYFCMEYGLAACLPIYAGGLGVLAGDHLKSASGLDVPLVAVGLLYSSGYFSQQLDEEGWQYEEYRARDLSTLPIRPVLVGERWRHPGETALGRAPAVAADVAANAGAANAGAARAEGAGAEPPAPSEPPEPPAPPAPAAEPLKVAVDMAGRTVWARVWEAKVGRISLYLLDSAMPENDPVAQRITGALYGGGPEERLAQELLLGIGGMRALRALGVNPDVCHLNEGHSVFTSLERIREVMHENGLSYHEARQATGGGTLFTTHTPVSAGFDYFQEPLIETYLGGYLGELGLDTERFMDMGRVHRDLPEEEFNVAVLALRQSPRRNAVSRLHRRTTARMMAPGWADFPRGEMPIESVTNGVHTAGWVASEVAQLYDRYLGPGWREDPSARESWQRVDDIPDEELWQTHARLRERLVGYGRDQARIQTRILCGAAPTGAAPAAGAVRPAGAAGSTAYPPLRPDALTIGFARRFATYKRATLLLTDLPRLKALLLDEERPVQLVMAGKAHPKDGAGKDFIREMLETFRQEGLGDHMVFIEDYDLRKAALLVQGADVWLNTPRRPFEACGTSGMKVVPNGGLNLSVLDGWWTEAYRPGVGWAIGDGQEFVHSGYQDEVDSKSLYSLLERQVVPLFYDRDAGDLPRGWIAMMKNSIKVLAPAFSGERMVKQYAERFYVPAAERYRFLAADGCAKARELNAWKFRVRDAWRDVKIAWVEEQGACDLKAGEGIDVTAKVRLGGLDPAEVVVEAYSSSLRPDGTLRNGRGTRLDWVSCENGEHLYRGTVAGKTSGLHGYAVRVLPCHQDVLIPNELPLIAWEEG